MKYKDFKLMDPVGYYMLVEMDSEYIPDEESEEFARTSTGTILVPKKTAEKENYGCAVCTIIAVGPDAYNDKFKQEKGSSKAWAKVGNRVMLKSYSGRIAPSLGQKFARGRFQYITDECVVAIETEE